MRCTTRRVVGACEHRARPRRRAVRFGRSAREAFRAASKKPNARAPRGLSAATPHAGPSSSSSSAARTPPAAGRDSRRDGVRGWARGAPLRVRVPFPAACDPARFTDRPPARPDGLSCGVWTCSPGCRASDPHAFGEKPRFLRVVRSYNLTGHHHPSAPGHAATQARRGVAVHEVITIIRVRRWCIPRRLVKLHRSNVYNSISYTRSGTYPPTYLPSYLPIGTSR